MKRCVIGLIVFALSAVDLRAISREVRRLEDCGYASLGRSPAEETVAYFRDALAVLHRDLVKESGPEESWNERTRNYWLVRKFELTRFERLLPEYVALQEKYFLIRMGDPYESWAYLSRKDGQFVQYADDPPIRGQVTCPIGDGHRQEAMYDARFVQDMWRGVGQNARRKRSTRVR